MCINWWTNFFFYFNAVYLPRQRMIIVIITIIIIVKKILMIMTIIMVELEENYNIMPSRIFILSVISQIHTRINWLKSTVTWNLTSKWGDWIRSHREYDTKGRNTNRIIPKANSSTNTTTNINDNIINSLTVIVIIIIVIHSGSNNNRSPYKASMKIITIIKIIISIKWR